MTCDPLEGVNADGTGCRWLAKTMKLYGVTYW
jgi:hypothetical protein